jgi:hypothetical protein
MVLIVIAQALKSALEDRIVYGVRNPVWISRKSQLILAQIRRTW